MEYFSGLNKSFIFGLIRCNFKLDLKYYILYWFLKWKYHISLSNLKITVHLNGFKMETSCNFINLKIIVHLNGFV